MLVVFLTRVRVSMSFGILPLEGLQKKKCCIPPLEGQTKRLEMVRGGEAGQLCPHISPLVGGGGYGVLIFMRLLLWKDDLVLVLVLVLYKGGRVYDSTYPLCPQK